MIYAISSHFSLCFHRESKETFSLFAKNPKEAFG